MKLKRKYIILLVAAALLMAVCGTVVCVKAVETPVDECLAVIDEYGFDDDGEIKYAGIEKDGTEKNLLFYSEASKYGIDADSKKVRYIYRNDMFDNIPEFSLSMDEAMEKAMEYVKKFRPDIDLSYMVLTEQEKGDTGFFKNGYDFTWRTIVNGVDINRFVWVSLNGVGELRVFAASVTEYFEPDISKITVDVDKAKKIAADYVGENFLCIDEQYLVVSNGRIAWYTLASYADAEYKDMPYSMLFCIDAETGEIFEYGLEYEE